MNRIDDSMIERVKGLSSAQCEWLAKRLQEKHDAPRTASHKRLVAYVVADSTATPAALRDYLRQDLPDYMVPWSYVTLPSMPLMPNGKVDRNAMPAPVTGDQQKSSTPRTAKEQLLTRLWCDVLGVDHVGIHSSFFELGGDSILILQMVSRARQQGLHLTPRQVFEHQSIAELALEVDDEDTAVEIAQGPVTGDVPLTPIQHYFFDLDLVNVNHWNMVLAVELQDRLEPDVLQQALAHVVDHHDALRSCYERTGGTWHQTVNPSRSPVPVTQYDLRSHPAQLQDSLFESAAQVVQVTLQLDRAPLLCAAQFTMGSERPDRLLMVAHHLAVDGVSWRIILEDLETAYQQLRHGQEVSLPPKSSSFQEWARRLVTAAAQGMFDAEVEYYTQALVGGVEPLPTDHADGENTESSAQHVMASLSADETRALLEEVPSAYHTHIDDVLRTALLQTLCDWTGSSDLYVDLEGHGREDLFDDINLSRTVGWFSSLYAVRLTGPTGSDVGSQLKSVKEQLRRVPTRGIGYGALKYLNNSPANPLKDLAQPQLVINYLGQFDSSGDTELVRTLLRIDRSATRHPAAQRTHLLEINAMIINQRLEVEWTYSSNIHEQETIMRLSHSYMTFLRALIAHCVSSDVGGFTPSDFPDAGLDQSQLDDFIGKITGPE
jgi:non-ribosomal peptide synthase protein (TIGR01720 family)